MDPDSFVHDVLALGLGDDVSLSEIVGLAIRKHHADEPLIQARDASLSLVDHLVRAGLARVGVLGEGAAFVDCNEELETLLAEVKERYDGSPTGTWREVLWVRNTPSGDRLVGTVADDYNPFDEDRRSGTGR